jgi:hypothetical protein
MSNNYVADFETTTDPNDCRVWGYGVYDIENNVSTFGNSISSFMGKLISLPNNSKIFFHNLKFDGEFILYHLKDLGYEWVNERFLYHNQFSTLITDRGVFYSITIQYKKKTLTILDSLKVIPLPVSSISKAFGIPQLKGEIDYNKNRPIGYKLTKEEINYIKNDIEIVGKAMLYFIQQGLTKMTQASNAFFDFKNLYKKQFEKIFPILEVDCELRKSYKGGWCYVSKKHKGNEVKEGIVLDVNSLYPSVMYYKKLPYGEPILYEGCYKEDKIYSLYIQTFRCVFKLKEGYLPTIQLKSSLGFKPTEYVEHSNNEEITLTLTSVDLEMFLEHYNVFGIEYLYGWKFKGTDKHFKGYIDKWVTVKNQASIDDNEGLRTIAKLMLNALYGKFALNPRVRGKRPVFENDLVSYELLDVEERNSVYLPVASFVTAYAREITIKSAQNNFDRFIYADTDSLHLEGFEEPLNIEIDKIKLGAWKLEYRFKRGKFIRAKAYIEELEDNTTHIACAGLPHRCHSFITFDNFKNNLIVPKSFIINDEKFSGKLQHTRVKGGVILKEIEFTIKV